MPNSSFVAGPDTALASPPAGTTSQLKGGKTPGGPELKVYEDQLPAAKDLSITPALEGTTK